MKVRIFHIPMPSHSILTQEKFFYYIINSHLHSSATCTIKTISFYALL